MAKESTLTSISPTVSEVIGDFVATLRDEKRLNEEAITRLETLLTQGSIPKPEEIHVAVFNSQLAGGK